MRRRQKEVGLRVIEAIIQLQWWFGGGSQTFISTKKKKVKNRAKVYLETVFPRAMKPLNITHTLLGKGLDLPVALSLCLSSSRLVIQWSAMGFFDY